MPAAKRKHAPAIQGAVFLPAKRRDDDARPCECIYPPNVKVRRPWQMDLILECERCRLSGNVTTIDKERDGNRCIRCGWIVCEDCNGMFPPSVSRIKLCDDCFEARMERGADLDLEKLKV